MQTDGAYMINLEGFIPKLCQLAQEAGEEEKAKNLRSAGLQALSSLVSFLKHKHGKEKFIFMMTKFPPRYCRGIWLQKI